MDKGNNKKIIISIFIIILMTAIIIGATYAWWAWASTQDTTVNFVVVDGNTQLKAILDANATDFRGMAPSADCSGQYVGKAVITLDYLNKTNANAKIAATLSLSNLTPGNGGTLTENDKEYIKWALTSVQGNCSVGDPGYIASGNLKNKSVNGDNVLYNAGDFNLGLIEPNQNWYPTRTYYLYFWIDGEYGGFDTSANNEGSGVVSDPTQNMVIGVTWSGIINGASCSYTSDQNISSDNITIEPTTCNNSSHALKRTITFSTINESNPLFLDLWLNVGNIDQALLDSNNFKYTIVPKDMNCNYGIHKSINSNISENKIMLFDGIRHTRTYSTEYDLYIWLDEAETNTNTMNTNFSFTLGGSCTDQITNRELTTNDAVFDTGTNVNIKMKKLAGDDTTANGVGTTDTNITAIRYSNTPPDISSMTNDNIVSISAIPIYMWYDNGVIYWWSSDSNPSLNSDASEMFRNCSNLVDITGLSNFDTSNTINIIRILFRSTSLTNISGLSNWDTSNVNNMDIMFAICPNLTDISALSNWDTSSVTTMGFMFKDCTNLTNINSLSNWNTSNVTTMESMFFNSYNNPSRLTDISALSNWDTSKVENMYTMFSATSINNVNALSNWNTSNVTNMQAVFQHCSNLSDISGLSNWDTSKVTTMHGLFLNNTNLTDITALSNWDTSSVTVMRATFDGCSKIINLNALTNWNTSNVTNMAYMFRGLSSLSDASAINNWDIKPNATFTQMFKNTPVHPEFTKVAGTWGANGTFTPNS